MFIRKSIQVAIATLVVGASAHASTAFFNNESAFLAASGGSLAFESFESATQPSSTSVGFAGGTFSCTGSSYCPGFFGITTIMADTGVKSIFFASPDTAIFTFNTAITAFGLHIGGAGNVGASTLTASLGNGDSGLALNNFSNASGYFSGNNQYFGAISNTGFTTVSFRSSNINDGIYFDSMSYGVTTAVPEPEAFVLMLAGLGLVGAIARRRKAKQA